MKNLKLCFLASTAILTNATIAYGSDEDSNAANTHDRSDALAPLPADCALTSFQADNDSNSPTPKENNICDEQSISSDVSSPVYEYEVNEHEYSSKEGKTRHHYQTQIRMAKNNKDSAEDSLILLAVTQADSEKELNALKSKHDCLMREIEQNIKDKMHEVEIQLDVATYSQYILTVLLGIEAFTHDPKADIDEETLFVSMKQLSESNLQTLMRIQNTCSGMDQLKCDALSIIDTAKSCGLYAHVNEEIAKTNVMALAHDVNDTRKLLDTFNADMSKKASLTDTRKYQVFATPEIKILTAQIWQQANQTKSAQELLPDVMRILDGTFIPFANYPTMRPELSEPAIKRLIVQHPETSGIIANISTVTAALSPPPLTTEETAHLTNLQKTITQGMCNLDAIRPETKIYKLMAELSSAVRDAGKQQDDELTATKATINVLLDDIQSREDFKILGMFIKDADASQELIEKAKALIA